MRPSAAATWAQAGVPVAVAGPLAPGAATGGQRPALALTADGDAAAYGAPDADPAVAEEAEAAGTKAPVLPGEGAYADPTAAATYAAAAAAAVAGLGMPLSFSSPSALFSAGGGAAGAQLQGPGTGGGAQGAFTFPAPPPANLYAPRPTSALAAALVSARAAAAAGQECVRADALTWQRERDAADTLARQIAVADQLLAQDAGATSSGSTGHLTSTTTALRHDPADPLVAQLHYQAGGVQNIWLLVPVVLDPESPSYTRWRDLVVLTLRRYALDDHVLDDPTPAVQTPSW
jgi:hypothetical protein